MRKRATAWPAATERASACTRREFLGAVGVTAASAATSCMSPGAAARRAEVAPAAVGDVVVDIHCHAFNASDLPLTGFLAHYVLSGAITDFSRLVSPFPETLLRQGLEWARRMLRGPTPAAAEELTTTLPALLAGAGQARPVAPLSASDVGLGVDALFGALGSLLKDTLGEGAIGALAGASKRLLDTLSLVVHDHAQVAATLAHTYPEVRLFTPLMVDYDAWSDDRPDTPLAGQVAVHELVAKLSMAGKLPSPAARLHPFVAFDPAREANANLAGGPDQAYRPFGDERVFREGDVYACGRPLPDGAEAKPPSWTAGRPLFSGRGALHLVRHAIERSGFLGVKVYPPVGFAPLGNARVHPNPAFGARLDLALHALYTYCQAEEVPITTHASPGNAYSLVYADLLAPGRWAAVLERYPRLRLDFGHFGHDQGLFGPAGAAPRAAWMDQAAALMNDYDGVFADLSFSPLVGDPDYARRYLARLAELFGRHPKLRRRVMYGSDWWLNQLEDGADTYLTVCRQRLRDAGFDSDTIRDIMGRNALRFLGFIDESSRPVPGRNQARLGRYYQDGRRSPPEWLVPAAG